MCVDAGLVHCLAAGFHPTLLIGDMDSVPPDVLSDPALGAVPRRLYPAEKDASDLQLALEGLADDDAGERRDSVGAPACRPEQVVIVGVSGGRTDHMLFNWLLSCLRDWPFELRFIDATTDAVLVTPTRPLVATLEEGDTVSLLPLLEAGGVHAEGLRYALRDGTLAPGSTRGLSNVADAPGLRVSIRTGRLLVLTARSRANARPWTRQ